MEPTPAELDTVERMNKLKLPEENLLYFIEKNSPILETWQREIVRIVRNIAQYFYPQKQTKMMNEGCATFVHHYIVNELFDRGLLTEGAVLEILHTHSNAVFQADFDDVRYRGVNPYALGFTMMRDIKRICVAPEPEDYEWFPEIAGNDDWRATLKDAWANYPRRVLHPAVSQPSADQNAGAVRVERRCEEITCPRLQHSRRTGLQNDPAVAFPIA